MDTTSIGEADICAALLATSEMMDEIDPIWWPQQEPTCLQHCYRSLGRRKFKKAAVKCTDYTLGFRGVSQNVLYYLIILVLIS